MNEPELNPEGGKYFTAREVTHLLPQLESIFEHIDLCRTRVEQLSSKMPRRPTTPAGIARQQLVRSQIEFLLQAVQEDIDSIARLGGVIKDLDAGLVDFLGWLNGADIWLCWKRGESSLDFWHPLHEGFSQRKSLPGRSSRSIH
jgi:hypothetical protein